MKSIMCLVVFTIAIFSCLFQSGMGLKCYQCESTANENCTYLMNLYRSVKPLECVRVGNISLSQSGFSPSCLKILTSNSHRSTVIHHVVRQCVWKYENQDPCASEAILLPYASRHTTYQTCTTCSNEDGCNAASSLKFFSAFVFIGIMLIVAFSIS